MEADNCGSRVIPIWNIIDIVILQLITVPCNRTLVPVKASSMKWQKNLTKLRTSPSCLLYLFKGVKNETQRNQPKTVRSKLGSVLRAV